jgi:hypothetical protein
MHHLTAADITADRHPATPAGADEVTTERQRSAARDR